MARQAFQLSEPYRRGLSSSLSVVEEMLSELNELLKSQRMRSVFLDVVNTLNREQRQRIQEEVENMRRSLNDIKTTLGLSSEALSNAALISSKCASIWEILCDLETKRLRRYGPAPAGLSDYLDPIIRELIRSAERIAQLAGKITM